MNRKIKFRAWQTRYEEMYYHPFGYVEFYKDKNVVGFDDGGLRLEGDDVVLMQYTGLKDKNGKEIYEGDIYKAEEPDFESGVYNWKIIFHNGKFAGESKECESICSLDKLIMFGDGEVIGNIYENPELI